MNDSMNVTVHLQSGTFSSAGLQWATNSLVTLPIVQEEKEHNMYDQNTEQNQRKYLQNRLYEVYYQKAHEGRVAFGLDNEHPKSQKQMLEWIKAGRYVYDETDDYIEWRDPAVAKDLVGYNAWHDKLSAANQAVKDAAVILPVTDVLKLLQEFEAATIQ